MTTKNVMKNSKCNKFSNIEELKQKLFPELFSTEKKNYNNQDARLLGVTWANESIDILLDKQK